MSNNTYPTTIPAMHRYLKAEQKEIGDRLASNLGAMAGSHRIDVQAAAVYRDAIHVKVLAGVLEDFMRVSRSPNNAPLYRARSFKQFLQDRLFETIGVTASPLVLAAEAEKGKVLKDLLRVADFLIDSIERAE